MRARNILSHEHGGIAPLSPVVLAPAMMLLPLIRWPLGYEIVQPLKAIRPLVVMLVITLVFWWLRSALTGLPPLPTEGRDDFYGLLIASFAMTCLRFARRFLGQGRGEEIHTAEAGYSFLARWLPFPAAFTEQLIVPTILGWLGWNIMNAFSIDLGFWLMVMAASYLVLSNFEWRNRMAQRRAPVDDKIRGEAFSQNLDGHEERAAKFQQRKASGKAAPLYGADEQPEIAEPGGGRRQRL